MSPLSFVRLALAIMFILPGILALSVSILGSKWFFNSHGTKYARQNLGKSGARLLYATLGVLLLGCGLWGWIHAEDML
ncbi:MULTISPECIES: Imm17 family immunity protein [Porphyromonas]|uniref:Imm17 family immunity protein n=1 Tax=Porphyromonas TaxID=836 RepID=UPI00068986A7|nr:MULTISPECIES: Imm17 family immunity protein [Porphyromonas]